MRSTAANPTRHLPMLSPEVEMLRSASACAMREQGDQQGGALLPRHLISRGDDTTGLARFDKAIAPLSIFQQSSARLGATNFDTDEDGIARHSNLVYGFDSRRVPQFAFAAELTATGTPLGSTDSPSPPSRRTRTGSFSSTGTAVADPTGCSATIPLILSLSPA